MRSPARGERKCAADVLAAKSSFEPPLMRRDTILISTIQFAIVAILFAAWYGVTHSQQRIMLLFPPPERVWAEMGRLISSGALWKAALVTLEEIAKAYVIAAVLGILVGFLVTRSITLIRIFEPVLSGVFA